MSRSTLCGAFVEGDIEMKGGLASKADSHLALVGSKKGRVIPMTHHIFSKERGWVAKPSSPHPTMLMIATPCPDDHLEFNHPVGDRKSLSGDVEHVVVADSGCQSTAIPPSVAYKAGYRRKDFLPVTSRMNGAGRSDLGVIGAVVLDFRIKDFDEITKQLCYVCTKIDRVYLSMEGLQSLGCLPPQFPLPEHNGCNTNLSAGFNANLSNGSNATAVDTAKYGQWACWPKC